MARASLLAIKSFGSSSRSSSLPLATASANQGVAISTDLSLSLSLSSAVACAGAKGKLIEASDRRSLSSLVDMREGMPSRAVDWRLGDL
jgi:hypothetical protein